MNLEIMAMRWLWLDKACHYVLEQRSPRYHLGSPDVLGVTKGRHLIEIEIKRSASDFYADAKKPHRANRDYCLDKQARQFYYLMPRELAEKLKAKIPDWAGLMCNSENNWTCEVLKVAPVNSESERLSIKECVRLCRAMTNHAMSYAQAIASRREQFKNEDSQCFVHWVGCDVGTYEI